MKIWPVRQFSKFSGPVANVLDIMQSLAQSKGPPIPSNFAFSAKDLTGIARLSHSMRLKWNKSAKRVITSLLQSE
jgi:hypothetical protein